MSAATWIPTRVNSGPMVTAQTLYRLRELGDGADFVLPICSLGTSFAQLAELGDWVLPPLYHEALTPELCNRAVERIQQCFPVYQREGAPPSRVRIVEILPASPHSDGPARVVAFSVDTAVEEHGPHLSLATDTIQSYTVLSRLAEEVDGFTLAPPVDYGQLTWGLPFGFSVDFTAELLTEYVSRFTDAVIEWLQPEAVYVVDVHGSIVHRRAIVAGLEKSHATNWSFRWLHQPLAEFASERGDQHAGAVETALVEFISPDLVDSTWWPNRIDEIAAGQMSFERAVELTSDLDAFCEEVRRTGANGIVGRIKNYADLDAALMFERMLALARQDVDQLLRGGAVGSRNAGENLW